MQSHTLLHSNTTSDQRDPSPPNVGDFDNAIPSQTQTQISWGSGRCTSPLQQHVTYPNTSSPAATHQHQDRAGVSPPPVGPGMQLPTALR